MNPLSVTYFLNGFLMVVMPIGLTILLTRKFKQGWRLFWIGAATFILSQVLHIPFNALVNPVFNRFGFIALPVVFQNVILSGFLGLSAGLFEELSRWVMYRWWAKDARSWGMGLLAGTGHGGSEAIILGLLVLYGYVLQSTCRNGSFSSLLITRLVQVFSGLVDRHGFEYRQVRNRYRISGKFGLAQQRNDYHTNNREDADDSLDSQG